MVHLQVLEYFQKSICFNLHQVPPEITRALKKGRTGNELKKSDMWSIGVCGYVLVTGYIPFSGDTMKAVMGNIKRRKREGLRFPKGSNLKKECIDFLDRLLCINVKTRLTAEEALRHPFITGYVPVKTLVDPQSPDESMVTESSSISDDMNMDNVELKENIPESESAPSSDGRSDGASLNRSSTSDMDTELTSSSED